MRMRNGRPFKEAIRQILADNTDLHAEVLEKHLGKHLTQLRAGKGIGLAVADRNPTLIPPLKRNRRGCLGAACPLFISALTVPKKVFF